MRRVLLLLCIGQIIGPKFPATALNVSGGCQQGEKDALVQVDPETLAVLPPGFGRELGDPWSKTKVPQNEVKNLNISSFIPFIMHQMHG